MVFTKEGFNYNSFPLSTPVKESLCFPVSVVKIYHEGTTTQRRSGATRGSQRRSTELGSRHFNARIRVRVIRGDDQQKGACKQDWHLVYRILLLEYMRSRFF